MMKRSFTGSTDRGRFFWVIPAFFLAAWYALVRARGPFWLGTNSDPEYAYLFNSLNLLEGRPILHVDHPGTPLHVLGAWVIRASQILSGGPYGPEEVLRSPESYLSWINVVLVCLAAASLLGCGWAVRSSDRHKSFVWVLPGTAVLSSVFCLLSVRVVPDLLLMTVGLAAVTVVFRALTQDPQPGIRDTLVLAVLSGLGLAAKVTFFPLAVFIFLILKGPRKKILYGLVSLLSLAVFVWPIRENIGRWLGFLWGIVLHTGIYGEGSPSVADPWVFLPNLVRLHQTEPEFFILFYAGLWTLNRKSMKGTQEVVSDRVLKAILTAQAVGIALVSKHSIPGKEYYLIGAMILSGWLLGILLERGVFKRALPVLLTLVLLWRVTDLIQLGMGMDRVKAQQLAVVRQAESRYQDHARIYYYRASSPKAALKFGDDFSGRTQGRILAALYDEVYFYDIWHGIYRTWTDRTDLGTIAERFRGRVLFQGSSFEKVHADHPQYRPDLALEDIAGGDPETLYLLST